MSSIIPNTQNFSTVVANILKRATQECGGAQSVKIKTPRSISSTSLRSWLFDNLKSTRGHTQLDNAIIKLGGVSVQEDLTHAYRRYFQARWLTFTVCFIALLFFVIGLVLCCALNGRVRSFARKLFCCRSENDSSRNLNKTSTTDDMTSARCLRSMPSHEQRRKRSRIIYLALTILSCLCMMLIFGLGIEAFLELFETRGVISCNMWLELSGYFHGATDLKDSQGEFIFPANLTFTEGMSGTDLVNRISIDWPGVLEIDDRMQGLRPKVNSTDEGSLYQLFMNERKTLKEEVDHYVTLVNTDLTDVNDFIESYAGAFATMKTELKDIATFGDWDAGYSFIFGLEKVYKSKQKVFQDEITPAVAEGWSVLDALIEKYAGATASITAKANEALSGGLSNLHQINRAIQAMADIWEPMDLKLKILMIVLIVISCLTGVFGLAAAGLSVNLVFQRTRKVRTFELENKNSDTTTSDGAPRQHKKSWLWAAVFCGLALSFSALLVAITFLLSVVGSDACQTIDQSLMTQGRWELLGHKILTPEGLNKTEMLDMRPIMDTCIKRGATGSIGITLGIDSQIGELSDDLSDAFDDINDTRERLLRKNSRNFRVHIIGFLMQELLRGFAHETHFRNDQIWNSKRVPAFNELQEINFENHTSSTEGRRVLLAPVPYWPSALNSILGHGLANTLGSIVDAYIALNEISDLAYKANSASPLPRFCGALAKKRKLACSYFEADSREIIDLSDPTYTDEVAATWLTSLDADVPSYGLYVNSMASRTRHLIGATTYVERAANLDAEALGLTSAHGSMSAPVCYDDDSSTEIPCTFDDARQYHQKELDKIWERLRSDYANVIDRYDAYVDDLIIPKSQAMVDEADSVIFESNCQFQGTQIDNGVYAPLCYTFMPLMTQLALLAFFTFAIMILILIVLAYFRPRNHTTIARPDTLLNDHSRRPSTPGAASKQFIQVSPHTLMVPNNGQHSISNASYQDSVRQYGSESYAPIFSPIRVRHYN